MSKISKLTKIIIFAVVFSLFITVGALSVNYLYAAWQGPTAVPADPNVATPIHTGGSQFKAGGLTVNGGLISNILRSIGYVGSKLDLGLDVTLDATDDLIIKSNDYVKIQGGNTSARIIADPGYGGVKIDDKLCLNDWTDCVSSWSAIAGLQSCDNVTCSGDHGAFGGLADDDHPLYLNIDGSDVMTGQLTVNNKIVANELTVSGAGSFGELCLAGVCEPSWPTSENITHASLTGLGNDDHPQYVNVNGDTMTGSLTLEGALRANNGVTVLNGSNILLTSGNVTANSGNITANSGNITATNGDINAGNDINIGNNIVADSNQWGGQNFINTFTVGDFMTCPDGSYVTGLQFSNDHSRVVAITCARL